MSKVYFATQHSDSAKSRLDKVRSLITRAGIADVVEKEDIVAVKTHFGEYGNTAYLRVPYVRLVVEVLKELGARPFVTDTTTLYTGRRHNAVDHLGAARDNGFTGETCGAPIIIADGLRGLDDVDMPVNGQPLKSARIARAIHQADFNG